MFFPFLFLLHARRKFGTARMGVRIVPILETHGNRQANNRLFVSEVCVCVQRGVSDVMRVQTMYEKCERCTKERRQASKEAK